MSRPHRQWRMLGLSVFGIVVSGIVLQGCVRASMPSWTAQAAVSAEKVEPAALFPSGASNYVLGSFPPENSTIEKLSTKAEEQALSPTDLQIIPNPVRPRAKPLRSTALQQRLFPELEKAPEQDVGKANIVPAEAVPAPGSIPHPNGSRAGGVAEDVIAADQVPPQDIVDVAGFPARWAEAAALSQAPHVVSTTKSDAVSIINSASPLQPLLDQGTSAAAQGLGHHIFTFEDRKPQLD
ncbi:hypothetical protein [Rhodoligotrophos ferricapiens]|uniref:hypothetical protein n=1 Tax=Rhodoligotrophos ferricapiens TaxID=3069264 RepID=UPI00315D2774